MPGGTAVNDGSTAVVTGGARGIGAAIARVLAGDGRPVAICDIDPQELELSAAELRNLGARVMAQQVDVTQEDQVARSIAAIEADLGPIGCLVNNAGITRGGASETFPIAEWRRLLDVNLTAAFVCAQLVGQRMLARSSGVIVNIASIYGMRAVPERAAYIASKFALVGLTQALAVEWAPRGVRVNAVAPGYVGTELFWAAHKSDGDAQQIIARVPAGRLSTVEDVASAVRYLSSADAAYVTGHTLVVDGGWLPNGSA